MDRERYGVISDGLPSQLPDIDPAETQEWLDSFDSLVESHGGRIWVESTLRSDLWIKADAGGRSGIVGDLPPDVVPFLKDIPGVAAVANA